MTGTFFAIAAAGWLASAVLVCIFMARRGHDGFAWFIVGLFLGPLAIPPALAVRWRSMGKAAVTEGAPADTGLVDVLVGYDASPESRAAMRAAQTMLGSRLGRLTIVTVVPIDAAPAIQRAALTSLAEAGVDHSATTKLLQGRPAEALEAYANEAGYELVVVGMRGSGLSKVLGSVARELSHSTGVPVLLVPDRKIDEN